MKLMKILLFALLSLGIFSFSACKTNLNNNENNGDNYSGVDDTKYSINLTYSLITDKNAYALTGVGSCNDDTIIIPKTYNNLPVISIGEEAFLNNKNIQAVYIPETITVIEKNAFSNCYNLHSVLFLGSAKISVIDSYAFSGCVSLEFFNFPSSVITIGEHAFSGCVKLNSVTYETGSKLEEIKAYAFYGCVTLTGMWIPKTVKFIHETAFLGCKNLITNQ